MSRLIVHAWIQAKEMKIIMGCRYLAGLQLLQFILFVTQSIYGLLGPKGYAPNLPRVRLT